MFILNTERTVEWPVDVEVPKDGGGYDTHRFTAIFKLLKQSAFDAIYAGGGTDADLVRSVVVGFRDVQLEGGGMPSVNELADVPAVRVGLVRAYIECGTGARRKNSPTPAAAGPAEKPNGLAAASPRH